MIDNDGHGGDDNNEGCDHNDDNLVGHDCRMEVDNDGHGGEDSGEESDHNDDNLVEHDLPSRRMEVDCKNNPSQLPIK